MLAGSRSAVVCISFSQLVSQEKESFESDENPSFECTKAQPGKSDDDKSKRKGNEMSRIMIICLSIFIDLMTLLYFVVSHFAFFFSHQVEPHTHTHKATLKFLTLSYTHEYKVILHNNMTEVLWRKRYEGDFCCC